MRRNYRRPNANRQVSAEIPSTNSFATTTGQMIATTRALSLVSHARSLVSMGSARSPANTRAPTGMAGTISATSAKISIASSFAEVAAPVPAAAVAAAASRIKCFGLTTASATASPAVRGASSSSTFRESDRKLRLLSLLRARPHDRDQRDRADRDKECVGEDVCDSVLHGSADNMIAAGQPRAGRPTVSSQKPPQPTSCRPSAGRRLGLNSAYSGRRPARTIIM